MTNKKSNAPALPAKTVNARELTDMLNRMFSKNVRIPLMIWGPPGIGKSSVVHQVCKANGLQYDDVRLSQLAPLDLRGLPRPVQHNYGTEKDPVWHEVTSYVAPAFLPRTEGRVLLLDEINMAPPVMMGLAQQLLLDRRMGDFVLPEDTFMIAAGNRKEDGASVNTVPTPVANRMIHVTMRVDLESFTAHAMRASFNEQVVAFLNFRPELLHKMEAGHEAWPSPRSWDYASQMHTANMEIYSAVGMGAAAEFDAFTRVYQSIPDLEEIMAGKRSKFPAKDPSAIYACVIGLAGRIKTPAELGNSLKWINADSEQPEWTSLIIQTLNNIDPQKMMALVSGNASDATAREIIRRAGRGSMFFRNS